MLMPCDPVITVADDVVFFECFSADESSYGCLTVNRGDGFGDSRAARSSARPTSTTPGTCTTTSSRCAATARRASASTRRASRSRRSDRPDYREEKIDLPNAWLRGFMQIQAAMGMPMAARAAVARGGLLDPRVAQAAQGADVARGRSASSCCPGKPPRLVLEPWEMPIVSYATRYDGPSVEPIRVWGGRRLMMLARLLPLAERFDVYLLGTGLPSFWVAHMGEMRLTLGLSGWTANDWTRGSRARPARAAGGAVAGR